MSNIARDVKSGIKGVRGAGDVLRGELLEATDKAVHGRSNDPDAIAAQRKHRAVADKGEMDLNDADEMIARRERARQTTAHGVAGTPTTNYNPGGPAHNPSAAAIPEATNAPRPTEYGHGTTHYTGEASEYPRQGPLHDNAAGTSTTVPRNTEGGGANAPLSNNPTSTGAYDNTFSSGAPHAEFGERGSRGPGYPRPENQL